VAGSAPAQGGSSGAGHADVLLSKFKPESWSSSFHHRAGRHVTSPRWACPLGTAPLVGLGCGVHWCSRKTSLSRGRRRPNRSAGGYARSSIRPLTRSPANPSPSLPLRMSLPLFLPPWGGGLAPASPSPSGPWISSRPPNPCPQAKPGYETDPRPRSLPSAVAVSAARPEQLFCGPPPRFAVSPLPLSSPRAEFVPRCARNNTFSATFPARSFRENFPRASEGRGRRSPPLLGVAVGTQPSTGLGSRTRNLQPPLR